MALNFTNPVDLEQKVKDILKIVMHISIRPNLYLEIFWPSFIDAAITPSNDVE